MVLDTAGYSVIEWTDYVNQTLQSLGGSVVPVLSNAEEWRTWAATVVLLPGISVFNPPDPYQFDDWRSWADAFNRTVKADV